MKALTTTTFLFLLTSSAFAQTKVTSCYFEMESWLEGAGLVKSQTDIILNNNKYTAKITNKLEGGKEVMEEKVEFSQHKVRAGLRGDVESDGFENLNHGEKLIVHAMTLSEDPILEGMYSAGLTLKNVRSVKVYAIGEKTNMGQSAIVEAANASGSPMGSFMGGFLLAPCKK